MAQTWECPLGHASKDPDNCDLCGEQIQPADNPVAATPMIDLGVIDLGAGRLPAPSVNPDGTRTCHAPDGQGGECGQVNQAEDLFCQLCQAPLDAADQAARPLPAPAGPVRAAAAQGPDPTAPRPAAAVDAVAADAPNGWELVAVVNHERAARALDRAGQRVAVVDDGELRFPLILRESLVGRRSDALQVYPEVELQDPAVSRSHAMVRREDDGTLSYVHLSAKSGSVVDGARLTTGRSAPLRAGSTIQVGAYTDITVRPR